MNRYVPSPVPSAVPSGLRRWLADELRKIASSALNADNVRLPPLGTEPERPQDGSIVYADGVNWNPGAGPGFYGREAGAWVKL